VYLSGLVEVGENAGRLADALKALALHYEERSRTVRRLRAALLYPAILLAVMLLVVTVLFSLYYTRRITRPLQALTEAAEQLDRGNYDFRLDYNGNDEVGRLTRTFKRLAGNMKEHISDLNKRVYIDALTSVKNKGAFADAMEAMQVRIDGDKTGEAFAVGMFDCDDLKRINDQYGHDKGDLYLKTACRLICRVFQHSPVFRVGGDEFAVILKGSDYENRAALVRRFEADREALCAAAQDRWEQVHVAMGIAEYDPQVDAAAMDVVRRADKLMYANKRMRKEARS
jgi:diguanylate cyclase (GGDEF)-like protein